MIQTQKKRKLRMFKIIHFQVKFTGLKICLDCINVPFRENLLQSVSVPVSGGGGGGVAQSVERATFDEEVLGSIHTEAARSLPVGSVSV